MRHPALANAIAFALIAAGSLAGCDQLGIESTSAIHARTEADAKAVGSACRHAMRAIEDCYTLNPKADKAAVYTGWREMDEYMRENKLDGIAPSIPRADAAAKKKAADEIIDEPKDTPVKAHAKSAH
ncbi:hypothetical protein [Sphaerotilus sp.]|jgi:hypothetical protein|uniref:hypothetical protein n=1 Tax=Sphaerotilus sp. TaxID=2093942 RepID=UPI0025FFBAC2|nr:hypothetical protein [Sphaerotilus sp.]